MLLKFTIVLWTIYFLSSSNAYCINGNGTFIFESKKYTCDTFPENILTSKDSTLFNLIQTSIDSTNKQLTTISRRLDFLNNIYEVYSGMNSQIERKEEIEAELNLKNQQKEVLEIKLTSLKDLLEQSKIVETKEQKEVIASRYYALFPESKPNTREIAMVENETESPDSINLSSDFESDSLEVITLKSVDYAFEVNNDNVMYAPPAPECEISFEGNDLVTNKYRKDVKIQPFFSYTDSKIRSYFKTGDFLRCDGFVSIYGGYNLVNLKIVIASKNAPKTYGSLNRGALLVIKLLNGERLYGNNVAPNLGEVEPYTGNTIYRTSYTVNKDALKAMSKYEVDKIGILWSSGYEEYEIYNVDFFIHQIACLNSN